MFGKSFSSLLYSWHMNGVPRISNSLLKAYRKLTQKKFRKVQKKFIVEGLLLVREALASDWQVESVLVSTSFLGRKEIKSIIHFCELKHIPVYEISEKEVVAISDTITPQGVLGVVSVREHQYELLLNALPEKFLGVALDDVADPGNVGTILRTADWFGADAVFLNHNVAELYNPKVVRASMGSLFHLPAYEDVELVEFFKKIKKKDVVIIATSLGGKKSLSNFALPKKSIFVFGNEARGISAKVTRLADEIITIPAFGKAESLNVAVACGAVLGYVKMRK